MFPMNTPKILFSREDFSSRPYTIINLPLEVQGGIVSCLDCFSIKSFLEAIPSWKKHTLHIQGATSHFYNIEGIDRVCIEDVSTWESLVSHKKSYFIKLYDVSSSNSVAMELLTSRHRDLLDKLSFLYIDDGGLRMDTFFSQQKFQFLGSNASKFMESWDGRFPKEKEECLKKMSTSFTSRDTLVCLNVTVENTFGGLNFPCLKDLRVHFREMKEIPNFARVSAAKLEFLRVYYDGDVPIFSGVEVASDVSEVRIGPQFELCDTKGFDYKSPPLDNHTFNLRLYLGITDLRFTRFFKRISLVGIHEAILWCLDPSLCTHLHVLRTILFKHTYSQDPPPIIGPLQRKESYHYVPDFPWWKTIKHRIVGASLKTISWRTNLDDSNFPVLAMKPGEKICSFTLYTSGKRFHLHPFFRLNSLFKFNRNPTLFQRITIISDVPKKRLGIHDHMLLLNSELEYISGSHRLKYLTIDGCYFNTSSNDGLDVSHEGFSVHSPLMKELRLRLVRNQSLPVGEEEHGQEAQLSTFAELSCAKLSRIHVTQAIGGEGFKPWKSIKIRFSTVNQVRGFEVSTDGSLEQFMLNGEALEQPTPPHVLKPDGYWHEETHSWKLLKDSGHEFEHSFRSE